MLLLYSSTKPYRHCGVSNQCEKIKNYITSLNTILLSHARWLQNAKKKKKLQYFCVIKKVHNLKRKFNYIVNKIKSLPKQNHYSNSYVYRKLIQTIENVLGAT